MTSGQQRRQAASMVASQAAAPAGSMVMVNLAASIDLIDQPAPANAARSSGSDTRRGPQSPGWLSLKHIR